MNSPKTNPSFAKEEGKKNNTKKKYYNKKKKTPDKIDKKEVKVVPKEDITEASKSLSSKKNKLVNKKTSDKTLLKKEVSKKENELIPSFSKKGKSPKFNKKEPVAPFERRKLELNLLCSYCHKKIQDPFSAIASPDNPQEVYHFDCAIDKIKQSQELQEDESVIYIGGGNFAIAKIKRVSKLKTEFEIICKIEFESKKEDYINLSWRKELQQK